MTTKCANCSNNICANMTFLQNNSKKDVFYSLCSLCINTCSNCGDDIGMSKSNLVSDEECTVCGHQNCRSCGLNIKCTKLNVTVCEDCIDNERKLEICNCLRYKLQYLQKLIGHK